MPDRPGDWTEELIGGPEEGRYWAGLLEVVSPLLWLDRPEELERWADGLEGLAERTGVDDHAERVEWLRACAELGRSCLESVEDAGLRFDWERRAIIGPKGEPGRPRSSHTLAVAAAWEQLKDEREDWYGDRTLQRVRDRLEGLLPEDELTDAKLKARIRRHVQGQR